MTGKVYFVSAEYADENGDVVIEDFDTRSGWYMSESFCRDFIDIVSMGTDDKLSCQERCFCKLYRHKIVDALKSKRYKYALKLIYFGALRFVKDHTYGL